MQTLNIYIYIYKKESLLLKFIFPILFNLNFKNIYIKKKLAFKIHFASSSLMFGVLSMLFLLKKNSFF